jgi:hypothetical protein
MPPALAPLLLLLAAAAAAPPAAPGATGNDGPADGAPRPFVLEAAVADLAAYRVSGDGSRRATAAADPSGT